MPGRILIIRGGAIGDFILTLPAIGLIREAFPDAWIEILGYRHILEIANRRHYADATRSIEYAALAAFFHPTGDLPGELCEYFAGFQQVVSYLYDPDGIFSANLHRSGVKNLISGPAKLDGSTHAARQLAAPLEKLALFLEDPSARFFPSAADEADADIWLGGSGARPFIAVHPGSGGERKNWPMERWVDLLSQLTARDGCEVVGIFGEADRQRVQALRSVGHLSSVRWLESPPLPMLGALLGRAYGFVGHDSGISHLAAAAGCRCVLLFGPTDPSVWAPTHPGVRVVQTASAQIDDIALESVLGMVDAWK